MINNSINKKFSILIGITLIIVMIIFTVMMTNSIKTSIINDLEKNLQSQAGDYLQTTKIYNDTLEENALLLFQVFEKSFLNLRKRGTNKIKINGVETLTLYDGFAMLNKSFGRVDRFKELTGAISAVYVKDENQYTNISSSILDEKGERILVNKIDPNGKIYKKIENKEKFVGLEKIAGKTYMSIYSPIIKDNEIIGALYIGYDFTKGLETLKRS